MALLRFLAAPALLIGTITAAPGQAAEPVMLEEAAATLTPNRYLWDDAADVDPSQPISVTVSIAEQKAYVYRGDRLIAVSAVSTGKEGKETPAGVFPILQKKVTHRSNLYDDAPMPFMQRLTWDGIAIHAGRNPGYAASHGCIRVPTAFAKKLFAATTLGTTVTVLDDGPALAGAAPLELSAR